MCYVWGLVNTVLCTSVCTFHFNFPNNINVYGNGLSRILAERNAALQRANLELRQLLQSLDQGGGNHAAHGGASSLIHQHQNGHRARNSSGHSLLSYDFSGNRDSGVHDDVINSGGSDASNFENRKEDDDSARGSTHSSNVSCGSLEEHVLNLNQNVLNSVQHGPNSDQHVLNLDQHFLNLEEHDFNLDQLETSAREEIFDKFDINLKNITDDGRSLAAVETDFSEESSSPGTKGSPPTLRGLWWKGSNHITLRSEVSHCVGFDSSFKFLVIFLTQIEMLEKRNFKSLSTVRIFCI